MDERQRGRRSVGRRTIGLGSVAIVLLCVALAVPAFGFASRSTATTVIRPLKSGSVTARCPKGEHVAFGGFIGEFRPPLRTAGRAATFPTSMRRTAPGSWTVTGRSDTVLTGSHLSAVAYCDRGKVSSSASNSVRLPGSRAKTVVATCPAGTVVVGGGYHSGSSATHFEGVGQLLALSPTRWEVSMLNLVSAPTTLTAIAYCAPGVAPTAYRSTLTLAPHKGGTSCARCPSGKTMVFGGVDTSEPTGPSSRSALVIPFSMTASSRTLWVATGYNDGSLPGTLTAVAYCR